MRKKLGKFQKSEVEFFLIGRSVLLCAICQIISVILIFCENIVYEEIGNEFFDSDRVQIKFLSTVVID